MINGLVIVIAGVMLWMFWPDLFPGEYFDDTTPDELVALHNDIDDFLFSVEPNFQDLHKASVLLEESNFTHFTGSRTSLSDADNYAKSVESIVFISIEAADGWIYNGSGSILTSDGVILTNYHVLEGAEKVAITTAAGEHYKVEQVLASDEQLDIVWLKIAAEDLTPLPIGDSDQAAIGDKSLVIGHAEGFVNTFSVGPIAGKRSYESQGAGTNIQITNPISMGNSGGALLNEYGEIIGVPTWSLEYDFNLVQVQNINFAVPINEALELLN